MKKKLVATLAAAMVLGVAGTSFAASNPFVDVPAKHWAYDAVTKLASAGIVDGYGDGTFKGDKTISRYEMAQIVAKAMARSDKATAEQKASIDKLSVEFASELEGLNVRVTKLEKNASTVKVTGEARLRFENYEDATTFKNANSLKLRTRVHLNGTINDQWAYYGRLQAENNLRGDATGGTSDNDTVTMHNAYVKGSLLGTTTTIGRFDYVPNFGLIMDGTLNGVKVAFGNVLQSEIYYGKQQNKDLWGLASQPNLNVIASTLKYATSKATTLNGGYYQFENSANDNYFGAGEDSRKVWEAGFRTQLATDWALKGSYGQSDADVDDKAYFAQIDYKGALKNKVGSYGAWVGYRNLEANAAPKPTFDGKYAFNTASNGGKGYEVGFNYTPALNTLLRVKYVNAKAAYEGASSKSADFIQAQAEFFF